MLRLLPVDSRAVFYITEDFSMSLIDRLAHVISVVLSTIMMVFLIIVVAGVQ